MRVQNRALTSRFRSAVICCLFGALKRIAFGILDPLGVLKTFFLWRVDGGKGVLVLALVPGEVFCNIALCYNLYYTLLGTIFFRMTGWR